MAADRPADVSPLVHVKRALSWNLSKVAPSPRELEALARDGIADPTVARYAAWRRSLLLVAFGATLVAFALAVLDEVEAGFGELTPFGAALEVAGLLAVGTMPTACLAGLRRWTRPGHASGALATAWIVAFVLPFVEALLPVGWLYHVEASHAVADAAAKVGAVAPGVVDGLPLEKLEALRTLALDFVVSGSAYLALLPAVLSLIPGAMNGCLRVKSLLPAAPLPGWLLVCAAPLFLLFWLVLLVVVNQAAQSPLLVFGMLLWAGSPVLYALRARTFVQPRLDADDVARITAVKRAVGLTGLVGIGLLLAFATVEKVAGLRLVGLDEATAMSSRLDQLVEDDLLTLEDVGDAFESSTSFLYALDLSSLRFVLDFFAKLLLVTAVFAHLVLRATLSAWRTDRTLRTHHEAGAHDAASAAALAALGSV
ncbi:MAG: hypothetical protein U1E39_16595 [Planctomycetota bacterium]